MRARSGRRAVTESTAVFFKCLILPRLNRLTYFLNKGQESKVTLSQALDKLVKSDRICSPLFEPRSVRKYLVLRLSASAAIRFGQLSRRPHTYQFAISLPVIPRVSRRSILPCGNSGEFALMCFPACWDKFLPRKRTQSRAQPPPRSYNLALL